MLGPLPVTGLCIVMCDTLLASEVKLMLGGFRKGLLVLKREIQEVISSIGRYWNCTECLQLLQPSQALGVHLIPGFFSHSTPNVFANPISFTGKIYPASDLILSPPPCPNHHPLSLGLLQYFPNFSISPWLLHYPQGRIIRQTQVISLFCSRPFDSFSFLRVRSESLLLPKGPTWSGSWLLFPDRQSLSYLFHLLWSPVPQTSQTFFCPKVFALGFLSACGLLLVGIYKAYSLSSFKSSFRDVFPPTCSPIWAALPLYPTLFSSMALPSLNCYIITCLLPISPHYNANSMEAFTFFSTVTSSAGKVLGI